MNPGLIPYHVLVACSQAIKASDKPMKPHQQRVVDEQKELEAKTVALHKFITENEIFKNLPQDEQKRMERQYSAMVEYNEVLNERIAAFPKE